MFAAHSPFLETVLRENVDAASEGSVSELVLAGFPTELVQKMMGFMYSGNLDSKTTKTELRELRILGENLRMRIFLSEIDNLMNSQEAVEESGGVDLRPCFNSACRFFF